MTSSTGSDAPQPYRPIDCSLHDRYEAWAVRRTPLRVRWSDGEGLWEADRVRITDIRIADGAEYLVLSDGSRVRMDYLLAVAPVERP